MFVAVIGSLMVLLGTYLRFAIVVGWLWRHMLSFILVRLCSWLLIQCLLLLLSTALPPKICSVQWCLAFFGRGCYWVSGFLCSVVGVTKFCWMQRILKIIGKWKWCNSNGSGYLVKGVGVLKILSSKSLTEPGEVHYLQMGRKGNRFFGLHLSCVFEEWCCIAEFRLGCSCEGLYSTLCGSTDWSCLVLIVSFEVVWGKWIGDEDVLGVGCGVLKLGWEMWNSGVQNS